MTIALWVTIAASACLVFGARIMGPDFFYITEREWQTAITAWWMVAEGHGIFDAVTPLMGPPWQIPMEAPLFQWLAAHATTPWVSLEDTGRLLSFVFFLAGIFVLRRLALDLDLDRRVADCAALIFATSPLYLGYALSFTIESLALLLALLYLWLFVRWMLRPGLVLLTATMIAGSAAALAKVTTWAVFAAAVTAVGLWFIVSARRHSRSTGDALIGLILVLGIPLACGAWWTHWSDAVKAANGLTTGLTSGALAQWNFGTLEQRLSVQQWGKYAFRSALLVLGPVGLAGVGPAIFWFFRRRKARVSLPVLAASLAALAAGPLVFTNLHFEHDYYALATGVFAIILLASTVFAQRARPWLVAAIVVSNLFTTGVFIAAKQANYTDPLSDGLAQVVAGLPEDRTIIVFGSYLDARVPYLAQKKALQTRIVDPSDPLLRSAVTSMKKQNVGAILTRSTADLPAARMAAARLGLHSRIDLSPGVRILTTPTLKTSLSFEPMDLVGEMDRRLTGFSADEKPGRFGIVRPSGSEAVPGIGLVRGGNRYLFDIKRGFRVVHRRWSPEGRGQ